VLTYHFVLYLRPIHCATRGLSQGVSAFSTGYRFISTRYLHTYQRSPTLLFLLLLLLPQPLLRHFSCTIHAVPRRSYDNRSRCTTPLLGLQRPARIRVSSSISKFPDLCLHKSVAMFLEIPRRRLLRTINSKYIYGRVVSLPRCTKPWRSPEPETNHTDVHNIASRTSSHLPHRDGHRHTAGDQIQYLLCREAR
jgi:hypothetical protein